MCIIDSDSIVELRLLRRLKPGHVAPALVQQLLCDLLGQLLFLAGKELVVFPPVSYTHLLSIALKTQGKLLAAYTSMVMKEPS